MSDLLAIFGPADSDTELLEGIAAYRPTRVTVLVPEGEADLVNEESSAGAALRDRLACLMAAIERSTGATVVGAGRGPLAADRLALRPRALPRIPVPA